MSTTKLLADAIRLHCANGETEHQMAQRIDMPHQRLYEFMAKSEGKYYDPGRLKMEALAAAIGKRWALASAEPAVSLDAPITALDLSARSSRVLASVSVETVRDLCSWTAEQLLATPGFGPACLLEVEDVLARHGLRLAGGAK